MSVNVYTSGEPRPGSGADRRRAPAAPLWLGAAGLVPFVLCTVALWLSDASHEAMVWRLLIGYGAVILSFVGALHWAFAMRATNGTDRRSWILYGWSVIPALIGWIALSVGPPVVAALMLITGFAIQYLFDLCHGHALELPRWFVPLRGVLSTVAVICLGVAGLS